MADIPIDINEIDTYLTNVDTDVGSSTITYSGDSTIDVNAQAAMESTSQAVADEFLSHWNVFVDVLNLGEGDDVTQSHVNAVLQAIIGLRSLYVNGIDGHYITLEMASNLDRLLKSLTIVGASIGVPSGANEIQDTVELNHLKFWKDLSYKSSVVREIVQQGILAATEHNRSLQALVEMGYVREGNEIMERNLSDLEEFLSNTKESITLLTELQDLHNNLDIENISLFDVELPSAFINGEIAQSATNILAGLEAYDDGTPTNWHTGLADFRLNLDSALKQYGTVAPDVSQIPGIINDTISLAVSSNWFTSSDSSVGVDSIKYPSGTSSKTGNTTFTAFPGGRSPRQILEHLFRVEVDRLTTTIGPNFDGDFSNVSVAARLEALIEYGKSERIPSLTDDFTVTTEELLEPVNARLALVNERVEEEFATFNQDIDDYIVAAAQLIVNTKGGVLDIDSVDSAGITAADKTPNQLTDEDIFGIFGIGTPPNHPSVTSFFNQVTLDQSLYFQSSLISLWTDARQALKSTIISDINTYLPTNIQISVAGGDSSIEFDLVDLLVNTDDIRGWIGDVIDNFESVDLELTVSWSNQPSQTFTANLRDDFGLDFLSTGGTFSLINFIPSAHNAIVNNILNNLPPTQINIAKADIITGLNALKNGVNDTEIDDLITELTFTPFIGTSITYNDGYDPNDIPLHQLVKKINLELPGIDPYIVPYNTYVTAVNDFVGTKGQDGEDTINEQIDIMNAELAEINVTRENANLQPIPLIAPFTLDNVTADPFIYNGSDPFNIVEFKFRNNLTHKPQVVGSVDALAIPNDLGLPMEDLAVINDMYGQLLSVKDRLTVQARFLEERSGPEVFDEDGSPIPGTLLFAVNAVLEDLQEFDGSLPVADKIQVLSKWLLDNYDKNDPDLFDDTKDSGLIQKNITDAIVAAQTTNDSQKEKVRRFLFIFEEYYKSASAILTKITQLLEKIAQNIAR